MKIAVGVITVIQEGRFRLSRDDGTSDLFFLSHSAPLEPQDLAALAESEARVVVHYEPAPGRVAGLVYDITRAPERGQHPAPGSHWRALQ